MEKSWYFDEVYKLGKNLLLILFKEGFGFIFRVWFGFSVVIVVNCGFLFWIFGEIV